MEFYPIDFVLHIINIVILFIFVRALAYEPIRKFMKAREEKIAAQLAEAEQARSDAQALQTEYQTELATARKARDELLAEGRSAAVKEAEEIRRQARQRADEIVQQAKADAERAAEEAMRSAEGELAETAVELAGRVLSYNAAARANAMAMHPTLEGTAAGVVRVAAKPDAEDAADIQRVLENLTGRHLILKTELHSDLLGGFIAYIEGEVYDFSYASQLKELQNRLG